MALARATHRYSMLLLGAHAGWVDGEEGGWEEKAEGVREALFFSPILSLFF